MAVKGMPPELTEGRHHRGFVASSPSPAEWKDRLLSFDEAKLAGQAMHDRRELMLEGEIGEVPLLRDDAGWADMFRVGWEAVWASRRGNG